MNLTLTTNGTLTGTEQADVLTALTGEIKVLAGGGNDTIIFNDSAGLIEAGDGQDIITSTGSLVTINGGLGSDRITADKGRYVIDGGIGNDLITTSYSSNTLIGGEGDDTFKVSFGDCSIDGGLGNDTVEVTYGNCAIDTGAGNDYIQLTGGFSTAQAGEGDDLVVLKGGNHKIYGGAGSDRIYGSDGDDVMIGGVGDDLMVGGGGFDTVSFEDATTGIISSVLFSDTFIMADGTGGTDQVQYFEAMRLTDHNDTIQLVQGSKGARIDGGKGSDRISGSSGNDILIGGAGSDQLSGLGGNDVLIGDGAMLATANQEKVYRLYKAALGREPDLPGLKAHAETLDAGKTLQQLALEFVASQEFQLNYGELDHGNFVTLLYNNVLNRAPDPAGLALWTASLWNGGSRGDVVAGFVESPEFQRATAFAATELMSSGDKTLDIEGQVFRLYRAVLGRDPDSGGFVGWHDQITEGKTLKSVAEGFVGSDEFQLRYGALDNSAFVELLYQNVLGRPSDAAGKEGWLAAMEFGAASRTDIVLGFSESDELKNSTATTQLRYLDQVWEWRDTLIAGSTGSTVMIGGQGADDYYIYGYNNNARVEIYGLEEADNLRIFGFGAIGLDLKRMMRQIGDDIYLSSGNAQLVIHDFLLSDITSEMLPTTRG